MNVLRRIGFGRSAPLMTRDEWEEKEYRTLFCIMVWWTNLIECLGATDMGAFRDVGEVGPHDRPK